METVKTKIIFENEISKDTLEQLEELRQMRLQIAKEQLANLEVTAQRLIIGGMLTKDEVISEFKNMKQAIEQKIEYLNSHSLTEGSLRAEDLSFYIDLLSSEG